MTHDRRLVQERVRDGDLASELAVCERRLSGLYARLQGAWGLTVRLEEENSRLNRENRLLQERLLTLRLQEGQRAREHPVFGGV